jgi:hypothetical protein
MKNIKDYLHLYLGCQCKQMGQANEDQTFTLTGISYDDLQRQWWAYFTGEEECYAVVKDVFPILRPLSDMTEEEMEHVGPMPHIPLHKEDLNYAIIRGTWTPEQTKYLLSRGFDLFGLIDSGLAIDKTKVNT